MRRSIAIFSACLSWSVGHTFFMDIITILGELHRALPMTWNGTSIPAGSITRNVLKVYEGEAMTRQTQAPNEPGLLQNFLDKATNLANSSFPAAGRTLTAVSNAVKEQWALLTNDEAVKKLNDLKERGSISKESYELLLRKYQDGSASTASLDGKITKQDILFMASVIEELRAKIGGDSVAQIDRALFQGGVAKVKELYKSGTLDNTLAFSSISLERARLVLYAFSGDAEAIKSLGELNKRTYTAPTVTADTFASGLFTGPAHTIGGSSAYHIDTKFRKTLSMEQKVAMVDAMAKGYAAQGRRIEFSNELVSGKVWDVNATYQEKAKLLRAAEHAHSHSVYNEWTSIDYYVPAGKDPRGGASSQGVEMILPKIPGTSVEYGRSGNYGNYLNILDSAGNPLVKTGHGDNRKTVPSNKSF